MMFLSNNTLGKVVKAQVGFKMNAYMSSILSLILIQLVALFFSKDGSNSMETSMNNSSIQVNMVTNDLVFFLVIIWALIVGYLITTKAYRYDDFSFVTTRLSSNLANIIVLCLMSLFAGITTFLSNYLLRIILFLFGELDYLRSSGILDDPLSSILTIIVIIFLVLTIAAGGYLAGILIQNNKVFMILIPIFIVSIPLTKFGKMAIQYSFGNEYLLLTLIVKLISITVIFFALAVVSSNRLEVRP